MVGFEIFLDVVVSVALLWLVGEGRKAPQVSAVEVEAEATPEVEVAIAVPDVDLPDIGELFAEADQVGDRYLAPQEIEERNAARAAIAQVFTGVPPHRHGGGRRRYQEALFAQAEALQERGRAVDAGIFSVAQVAVNVLAEEGEALTAQRV